MEIVFVSLRNRICEFGNRICGFGKSYMCSSRRVPGHQVDAGVGELLVEGEQRLALVRPRHPGRGEEGGVRGHYISLGDEG
jgi:hypothetical protein